MLNYSANAKVPLWRPAVALVREHRGLLASLVKREVTGRYKGSLFGAWWAFIQPAAMIAVFTIIFSGIFGARFPAQRGHLSFAVHLFCGLLPWMAFSEGVQRATNALVENVSLVKRVVFPVEALPANFALAAVVQQLFGTAVLLVVFLALERTLHATALLMPLLLVPQLLVTLGLGWLAASLGVFVRDLPQVNQLLLMAWMYLTPIFYPEAGIPPQYAWLVKFNPMAPLVRSYRNVLLEGRLPDWRGLGFTLGFGLVCFAFGYGWFERTKKAFADVL
jgi:lipopolysaccharide transport system permease protein